MKSPEYYVGIDISSADFAVCAGTMPWQIVTKAAEFENNQAGFKLLRTYAVAGRM
jgi:hypothetical protein